MTSRDEKSSAGPAFLFDLDGTLVVTKQRESSLEPVTEVEVAPREAPAD